MDSKDRKRQYQQKYYAANRARLLEHAKAYRAENLEERLEYDRKRWREKKEELNARRRAARVSNPALKARNKEATSKWVSENRSHVREYQNKYARKRRAENPGIDREKRRRYEAVHPDTIKAKWTRDKNRRRAAKRAQQPTLTAIERARYQEFYDIARARTAQTGEQWHVDHDKPLALGGLDHPDNLMLLPSKMNSAKGARYNSTFDFICS